MRDTPLSRLHFDEERKPLVPSPHIDAILEKIDRLFPIENERNKQCWKCQQNAPAPGTKVGLCKKCLAKLKGRDD